LVSPAAPPNLFECRLTSNPRRAKNWHPALALDDLAHKSLRELKFLAY
jgi:hypothetical protein